MNIPLRQYWELLTDYLKPQWRKATLLALFLLGSIGLQLVQPQILRQFIDTARAGGAQSALIGSALTFIAVGLIGQVLSTLATYLGADVGWTATNRLREDLALHCLQLDMPFHNERTPGELIERIDGDVTSLTNFFSNFLIRVLGSALLLIGILVLIFQEDPRAGVILTLFALVAFLFLYRTRSYSVEANKEERETAAQMMGFIEERLAGVNDIRANGAGAYVMRRFYEVSRVFYQQGRRAWRRRMRLWISMIGIFNLGEVIALAAGVYLFQISAITLGTVYLFFRYTQIMQDPIRQITRQMQQMQQATAGIERIRDLLSIQRTLSVDDALPLPDGPLSLTFEGVTFAYHEQEGVLKDIFFHLEAGKVLGLLGRTGSGKTTPVRLLFRLYDPTAGMVQMNGLDVRNIDLDNLRNRVGMVTQDVQIFHASVRDNLTFFDGSISDERLMQALADLHLDGWLAGLPKELDTELASGGSGLSAGEAQLLAFARVFLIDPGLVILDEPSSRLDPATEFLLEQAVSRLLHNRTAIIIAHRLRTVERADEVMILEDGKIREHGKRRTLASDPDSHFYQLLQTGLEQPLEEAE